ncbi:DinB family protein [Nocardioides immobilis]|uniref:DinB family protein n=1 Tax=Nocardioides immobilis TaxID=2049295 RepID=A0A417XXS0_9ACTN|nr:DinB family protein [Nocardioides immobilis]RHW25278.1 DinB family protein [Nocardioides immobilis]
MAEFIEQDLSGSRFERVDLRGSTFTDAYLNDIQIRDAILSGMRVNEAILDGVEINAEIRNVRINGVDVAPLVEAELDRRYPQRAKMRPTTAAGFAEAWEILGMLWSGTIDRARTLPPDALHERVDGEWSFIETLRHLSFASAAWVARGILRDPSPWHPLDLPWDGMPDKPGIPRDRDVRPDLDTVLALRDERRAMVARVIDGLTDESLVSVITPPAGDSWPPSEEIPLSEPLLVVLNEEWQHRLYAERDLDMLAERHR